MQPTRILSSLVLLALGACSSRRTVYVTPRAAHPVEIEVEVYDPETNFVWEGVSVRVVEGYHEWSGCTCETAEPDLWLETDETGRVLFTSEFLADVDIGFRVNELGEAVIEADAQSDEAFVLIELDAIGFDRVQVDVPVSWDQPSVLVSVPFSEPNPAAAGSASGDRPVRRPRPE